MYLKCIHVHSNECSKYMYVMEQNNTIHYNLYAYLNVQQRVTILWFEITAFPIARAVLNLTRAKKILKAAARLASEKS